MEYTAFCKYYFAEVKWWSPYWRVSERKMRCFHKYWGTQMMRQSFWLSLTTLCAQLLKPVREWSALIMYPRNDGKSIRSANSTELKDFSFDFAATTRFCANESTSEIQGILWSTRRCISQYEWPSQSSCNSPQPWWPSFFGSDLTAVLKTVLTSSSWTWRRK